MSFSKHVVFVFLLSIVCCCSKPLLHKIDKRFVVSGNKWDDCVVTWAFRDPFKLFDNDVDYDIAKLVFRNVMKTWEKGAGGTLTFVDLSPVNRNSSDNFERKAKLDIIFANFDHGDKESFDGPGGLIAHSGYPQNGIVHFDASEKWTVSDDDGDDFVDLRYAALHEVGHSLGLKHSTYPSAIMNEYYCNRSEAFSTKFSYKLSKDDVLGVQELYDNCIQSR